jgi:demethylmenaquinone methyltransferase/2-methoxy-6-polyprenyl-1,4-benzoquinol methylase
MLRIDPTRKSSADVRRLFEAIAPRYDLLNRLLSAGTDVRWRKRAVATALAGLERADVADLCCGTGDLALEFARDARTRRVVGVDFAPAMVALARRKEHRGAPTRFAAGDALHSPLRAASFDVAAVAFGLRNLVDPRAGVAEMRRLLRPGGRLLVLEFFTGGRGLRAAAFRFYFRHVLPRVGRLLAGTEAVDAYRYLPDSVAAFAAPEEVLGWCREAGFEEVGCERLLAGAVGLIRARLPPAATRSRETARAACFV